MFLKALRRRKPIVDLLRETQGSGKGGLSRSLGVTDIILYGVGSSVGAGIYSLIGVGVSVFASPFPYPCMIHAYMPHQGIGRFSYPSLIQLSPYFSRPFLIYRPRKLGLLSPFHSCFAAWPASSPPCPTLSSRLASQSPAQLTPSCMRPSASFRLGSWDGTSPSGTGSLPRSSLGRGPSISPTS